MRAGLAVALVDPGTLLARDVKSVLEERGFPYGHVSLFHSRSASDGLLVDDDGEAALALPLAKDSLASSDVAFFCGRAEDTQRFLKIRGRDGCVAIDLSGLREGGPFVSDLDELPDVSRGLLLTRDPTALVVADALRRFRELVEITSVDLAIDRPASELGKDALDELFQQAIAVASFRSLPNEVLGARSAFNVYHPIDSRAYEDRVREDIDALFGRPVVSSVFSARAGIFHGHHVRLAASFRDASPSLDALTAALLREPAGFALAEPGQGAFEAAGKDVALVLRLDIEARAEAGVDGGRVLLALASDHLRRAGAVLAVRLAEAVAFPASLPS